MPGGYSVALFFVPPSESKKKKFHNTNTFSKFPETKVNCEALLPGTHSVSAKTKSIEISDARLVHSGPKVIKLFTAVIY
jgi:hypothetical protein